MKHTPGPWAFPPADGTCVVVRADGSPIARIVMDHHPDSRHECEACANGRVMAAAPDFLGACQGPDPDTDRLSWLSALLTELDDSQFARECEDPDAMRTAILECQMLRANLQSAVKKAQGEQS